MQWSSVKKPVKKRFLKHTSARALLLLDAGNYPSRVARILGFSPQLMHYHIKKWLKMGWIRLDVMTPNMTSYKLAPSVKKSLTGGEGLSFKGVRLHAYSLKFPVLNGPGSSVDWNRVQLANWTRLVGCECGLTVEKTTKHVIVHADEILSEDPNEATLLAILECLPVWNRERFDDGIKMYEPFKGLIGNFTDKNIFRETAEIHTETGYYIHWFYAEELREQLEKTGFKVEKLETPKDGDAGGFCVLAIAKKP